MKSNIAVPALQSSVNQILATVKVVNETGKYEILKSSHPTLIPIGKTYNSTIVAAKKADLGSQWSIVCHLSQGTTGSVKIDEIKPFAAVPAIDTPIVAAAPAIVPTAPDPVIVSDDDDQDDAPKNAPVIVELPKRYIPSPIVGTAKTITADLSSWDDDNGYYISPNAQRQVFAAVNLLRNDPYTSVKILMTGESGYGKTSIAKKIADKLGLSYFRMNCAAVRDPNEWFFDIEVKTVIVNGQAVPETIFTVSEFAERIAAGNCVIVLDEFNRLESNMHNTLFPLLDDDGCTRLHHIDFRVGPNVIFIGTVNLGAKFAGTFLLDDALTNRFDMLLEVKPLPVKTELTVLQSRTGIDDGTADQIVSLAMLLRENDYVCSTRDTLKISKLVMAGLSPRDAFEFVIVLRVPDDENSAPVRKAIVEIVNRHLGERDAIFAAAPSYSRLS